MLHRFYVVRVSDMYDIMCGLINVTIPESIVHVCRA